MTNFMEELLRDVEAAEERQRLELNRLRADEALGAIAILESEIDQINMMCDQEIQLIQEYRARQTEKLDKRISWLAWNLEQFIRSTDQKTIELPRGELKLRMGRVKVDVIDSDAFLKVAEKYGLLRLKPSERLPDLSAIHSYVKRHKSPPPGCALTPATVHFTYKTKGKSNGEHQRTAETETGIEAESTGEIEAAS